MTTPLIMRLVQHFGWCECKDRVTANRLFWVFCPAVSAKCIGRHNDTITSMDFYSLTVAVQLAVYNGVVLSWREKVAKNAESPRDMYIYASCIVWLFFSSLIPIHYVHAFSCSFSLPKDKSDRRSLSRLSPSPFLDLYINYLLFTIAGRSFLFLIISFWCVCLGHQFAALSIGLCIPFS